MSDKYLPQELKKYWNEASESEYGYEEIKEKLRTAYALNLCTVSVSRIIDNRDQYVMDQEYDAILNNLNLQNMPPDNELLKILKEILDVITFFRIQDGDKKFIEEDYKAELKQNMSKAVNVAGLLGSISSIGITNLTNPVGWIKAGVSIASTVGIGYMNYQSGKSQARLKKRKQEWELQRTAIEQLNGLRRELLDTAWHITKNHDINDEFRLTEIQIKQYLEILKDSDDFKRFERLDFIKNKFFAYPPFWYQLGHTAKLVALNHPKNEDYYNEYAKACFTFFCDQVDVNLLRDDEIASSCALEYVELLDPEKEKEKILKLLELAVRFSGNKNDILQLCAIGYMRIGELNVASRLLWRLVNEKYEENYNAELLSLIYFQLYFSVDKGERYSQLLQSDGIDSNYCMIPIKDLEKQDKQERLAAIIYIYNVLRLRVTEDAYLVPLPLDDKAISLSGYIQTRSDLLKLKIDDLICQIDYKYIKKFIGLIISEQLIDINEEISQTTKIQEWIKANIDKVSIRTGGDGYFSSLSPEPFRIKIYRILNEMFKCIGDFTYQDPEVENQVEDLINDYIVTNEDYIKSIEDVFDSKNEKANFESIKNDCRFFDISSLFEIINPVIQMYYYYKIENIKEISEISELEHQIYVFSKDYDLDIPIIPFIGEANDKAEIKEHIPFTLNPQIFGIDDLDAYENNRKLEKERVEAIISKFCEYKDKILTDDEKCEYKVNGDDNYIQYIMGQSKFVEKVPIAVLYCKRKLHKDITLAFDTQGVHWIEEGISTRYLDVKFGEKNVMILSYEKEVKLKGVDLDALRSLIEQIQPIVTDEKITERKYLNEEWIESKALKIVKRFTVMAAMNGGNPIPLANIAPQLSIQVSMMYAITNAYKIHVEKEKLKDLVKEVISKSSSNIAKQEVIKSFINFIPGGLLVSAPISAASTGALTYAMGVSFIDYCKDIIDNHEGKIEEDFVQSASQKMLKKFDEVVDVKEEEIRVEKEKKAIETSWDLTEIKLLVDDTEKTLQQTQHNIKVANKIITEENQMTSNQIETGWDDIHKKMNGMEDDS